MIQVKHSLIAATLAAVCSSAGIANAADIKLSGFFNAVGNKHDAKDLRYAKSANDIWGFKSTALGIGLASHVDDNITLAAQLFADDEGVTLDWAFGTYKFNDSSAIKFGKIKYAGNLYSETVEVGFVYPWVRPPESVYSESSGLFLEAYEGASYKFTGGDDTEFAVEVYYGATDEESDENLINNRDQMLGLVISAENEIGKVQLSYNNAMQTSIDLSSGTPTPTPTPTPFDGKAVELLALGAEANFDNLQLIAEFAQDSHEDLPTQDRTGWFVTTAYTFGNWKPHLTFQDFSIDDKSVEQSSITAGLNRRVGNSAVLKFEIQQINDIIGNGLFEDTTFDATALQNGSDVLLYSIAFNLVF